jgi:hypothetical protein
MERDLHSKHRREHLNSKLEKIFVCRLCEKIGPQILMKELQSELERRSCINLQKRLGVLAPETIKALDPKS